MQHKIIHFSVSKFTPFSLHLTPLYRRLRATWLNRSGGKYPVQHFLPWQRHNKLTALQLFSHFRKVNKNYGIMWNPRMKRTEK